MDDQNASDPWEGDTRSWEQRARSLDKYCDQLLDRVGELEDRLERMLIAARSLRNTAEEIEQNPLPIR